MKLLWITDAWNTLDHPRDTSLRIIEECLKLGAKCFWCDPSDISLEDGKLRFLARSIVGFREGRGKDEVIRTGTLKLGLSDIDQLFYRTDPPVDLHYLQPLLMIRRSLKGPKPRIHAPIELLQSGCEKLLPQELSSFGPKTLVSSKTQDLLSFVKKQGTAIIKPLHGAQSIGVTKIDAITESQIADAESHIFRLSQKETLPIVAQEFLPGALDGETRVWFLNGALFATARKTPKLGDSIINLDQGGGVTTHTLTAVEKKISNTIGSWLKKNQVLMAAVDLIDGKITDFNFTSPGMIVHMEQAGGKPLAPAIARVILSSSRRS
jgi:glutathione synthase